MCYDKDESILESVRVACDLDRDENGFDDQLIPLTNTQIMLAHEFGVGYDGFLIHGVNENWSDLLGEHEDKLAAIKTWMGLSVKMLFDPPDNSSVLKAYQDQLAKMEWMLCSKSQTNKFVKDYVPEHADVYDD